MLLSWVQRKDTQDGLIVSVLKPEVISIAIGVSFYIALQRQEICHRPISRAQNCLVKSLRRWCFHLSHSAFSGLCPLKDIGIVRDRSGSVHDVFQAMSPKKRQPG